MQFYDKGAVETFVSFGHSLVLYDQTTHTGERFSYTMPRYGMELFYKTLCQNMLIR